MYGGERAAYRVWWRSLRKQDNLEDAGLDKRIILKWMFKKWNRRMDWIDRAWDRDRWRVPLNVVMTLRVSYN
jgi:hypothetical protein